MNSHAFATKCRPVLLAIMLLASACSSDENESGENESGQDASPDALSGTSCEYQGRTLEDGESYCVNPSEAAACSDGSIALGECVPGLACVERARRAFCDCVEVSDGFCPNLTDVCDDIDPDCLPAATP